MKPLSNFLPILFIFFFVPFLYFVSFLLSRISGWNDLAQQYRLAKPFTGRKLYMRSARMGWVSYRSVLMLGANEEGLYLGIMPIFFFAMVSPPLLIPWDRITRITKGRFLFWDYAALEIKDFKKPFRLYCSLDFFRPWVRPDAIATN